jgi:hypothetical protein
VQLQYPQFDLSAIKVRSNVIDLREINNGTGHFAALIKDGEYSLKKIHGEWSVKGYSAKALAQNAFGTTRPNTITGLTPDTSHNRRSGFLTSLDVPSMFLAGGPDETPRRNRRADRNGSDRAILASLNPWA